MKPEVFSLGDCAAAIRAGDDPAAVLKLYGESEYQRGRAEALEEAARLASSATANPDSRLIHPDIPFAEFSKKAKSVAHACAQSIAAEIRALAQPPEGES